MRWKLMTVACFAWLTLTAGAVEAQTCSDGKACLCSIDELHPTQVGIGLLEVDKIVAKGRDALNEHNRKKPARVVIGPEGVLYITDGHHHARAMSDLCAKGPPGLCIKQTPCEIDRSPHPEDPAAFWQWMQDPAHLRVHLEDENGRPVSVDQLPANLAAMRDDPYRSLAGWVSKACGFDSKREFAQFALADFLRSRVPVSAISKHKKKSVAAALPALRQPGVPPEYALKPTDTCRKDVAD